MTDRQSHSQHMDSTLRDSAAELCSRRPTAIGPLESACRDARRASEQFAAGRLRSGRLASLLMRTDRMLTELEVLNLRDVERVPEPWLGQLAELVADLPFDYQPPIEREPSPTAAIEVVFEIQESLLCSITGREADHDDMMATAS
jgi:hypothetical protein